MKILLLLLLLPFNVLGAELIIEKGQSTVWFADPKYYTPASYGAVAVRSEGNLFIEAIQGGWSGVNNSRFIGLSIGGRSKDKFFAEWAVGRVHLLKPETTQLDGPEQFLLTLGIGGKFDNLFITARLRHFSNGNVKGSNHGFEVLAGSIGIEF